MRGLSSGPGALFGQLGSCQPAGLGVPRLAPTLLMDQQCSLVNSVLSCTGPEPRWLDSPGRDALRPWLPAAWRSRGGRQAGQQESLSGKLAAVDTRDGRLRMPGAGQALAAHPWARGAGGGAPGEASES